MYLRMYECIYLSIYLSKYKITQKTFILLWVTTDPVFHHRGEKRVQKFFNSGNYGKLLYAEGEHGETNAHS